METLALTLSGSIIIILLSIIGYFIVKDKKSQEAVDLLESLVYTIEKLTPGAKEVIVSVLGIFRGVLLTVIPPKGESL